MTETVKAKIDQFSQLLRVTPAGKGGGGPHSDLPAPVLEASIHVQYSQAIMQYLDNFWGGSEHTWVQFWFGHLLYPLLAVPGARVDRLAP